MRRSTASLQAFWRFVESRPRPCAAMEEWKGHVGECFDAVRPLLHPRVRPRFVLPEQPVEDEPLAPLSHDAEWAVAHEGASRLAPEDQVVYELHLSALRRVVCGVLGLDTARTPVGQPVRDLLLGSWEAGRGLRFAARLLLPYGRRQLADLVYRRIAEAEGGELLFTPTRRPWEQPLHEAARQRKRLLVPLSEVLGINGPTVQATEAWDDYLRRFAQVAEATRGKTGSAQRPRRKRAERAAKIERIREALVAHFRAARDHAFASAQQGDGAELLQRPSKKVLARLAGVQPHDVSRCFRDDPQLVRLYDMADSLEDVMRFGR